MIAFGKQREKPRGLLDALASRLGIVTTVGVLVGVCVGAGLYTQSLVENVFRTQKVFADGQVANGYVAMSDVHRLSVILQQAVGRGRMDPELEAEFRQAADILYVRADHLRSLATSGNATAEQVAAIGRIDRIVEIADEAMATGFADPDAQMAAFLVASEAARRDLLRFLETMRIKADEVMAKQAGAVSSQQKVVLVCLAGLTLAGCVALFLLRLEILGRRMREQAEERVQFLAFFDPLTELPNRVQFQDRLQAMLDTRQDPVALLAVDVDEFKAINDTFGHAAGDAVLRRVGRILTSQANRYRGFAARLAGDEFALVVPGDDMQSLKRMCEAILVEAAEPFEQDGETLCISLSVGLATTSQVSRTMGATVEGLSRVSDFALYASKSQGRNRFTLYDQALDAQFLERRAMLEELPGAIRDGSLLVYLQPKVMLPDARVYGFEALVRWQRGARLVPPDEFILLAEESGLVVEVDTFILETAARLVADWNEQHGTAFSVSVNLSTQHFTSQRIIKSVEHALWRSDIRPDLLTLEITESTEIKDWENARAVISSLRRLGCRFAIDDFGTGFSSLAYLRSMEADELKIDRSLVEEIEHSGKARLMLSSVFELARHLDLAVTVEGIETHQQANVVHSLGARRAQGFFFGRPAPHAVALEAATGRSPFQAGLARG